MAVDVVVSRCAVTLPTGEVGHFTERKNVAGVPKCHAIGEGEWSACEDLLGNRT